MTYFFLASHTCRRPSVTFGVLKTVFEGRRLQTLTLAVVKCFSVGQGAVSTPVMCSDVVVYPYQIYQARLAGADALKLVAPALPSKVRVSCYTRYFDSCTNLSTLVLFFQLELRLLGASLSKVYIDSWLHISEDVAVVVKASTYPCRRRLRPTHLRPPRQSFLTRRT